MKPQTKTFFKLFVNSFKSIQQSCNAEITNICRDLSLRKYSIILKVTTNFLNKCPKQFEFNRKSIALGINKQIQSYLPAS